MSDGSREVAIPYRPDIDGLRALSVAGVVLFHAGVPGLSGGFVGVDVFFVISGYLIAQWLTRRVGSPSALLREFYVRRARRILPALALLLAVTTTLAWNLFLPADLIRFGKYLLGAVCMAGNFAAWSEGDYFNSAVGFAPLLHLWSIAVEEQFYLLFPLLMLGLRRASVQRQMAVIGALAAVSFTLCVYGSYRHPVANFYLGATRAWELMLGALLTYGSFDGAARRFAGWLAGAGLLGVLIPMFTFHREIHYPGVATLLPAAGTVALIVAGRCRRTPATALLAFSPGVLVGRASYSIYLWHLPPLVFATYYLVDAPSAGVRAAIVVISLAIAFAAWWGFEEPLRRRRWLRGDALFLVVMTALFATLAAIGASWWRSDGRVASLPASEQRLLASAELHRDAPRCMVLSPADIAAGRLCHYGPESSDAPRALLWGDSHALALLPAFEALAVRDNVSLLFAGTSACRPLPGYRDADRRSAIQRVCTAYNDAMRQAARTLRPDVIILAAFWAYPGPDTIRASDGEPKVALREALQATVRELGMVAHRICLVRDVPVLPRPVPYALIMRHRRGLDAASLGWPDPEWAARQSLIDDELASLARASAVVVVDPKETLCPDGICRIEQDGDVLFRDSNHLSVRGAGVVTASLDGCLANLR